METHVIALLCSYLVKARRRTGDSASNLSVILAFAETVGGTERESRLTPGTLSLANHQPTFNGEKTAPPQVFNTPSMSSSLHLCKSWPRTPIYRVETFTIRWDSLNVKKPIVCGWPLSFTREILLYKDSSPFSVLSVWMYYSLSVELRIRISEVDKHLDKLKAFHCEYVLDIIYII